MYLAQIGCALRMARKDHGLTQAELASKVGVSRTTVNQIECGAVSEIGISKLAELLASVGLELNVGALSPSSRKTSGRDFLRLACISANVSFREALTPDALATSLLTGKVAAERRPHLRAIFDELPDPVFDGMIDQVSRWAKPDKVRQNVESIGRAIHSRRYAA